MRRPLRPFGYLVLVGGAAGNIRACEGEALKTPAGFAFRKGRPPFAVRIAWDMDWQGGDSGDCASAGKCANMVKSESLFLVIAVAPLEFVVGRRPSLL